MTEKLKEGTRVRVANTGDEGTVVAVDGLVYVTSPYSGLGKVTVFVDGTTETERFNLYELVIVPPQQRAPVVVPEYVALYNEFWKDLVENAHGEIILDAVQRELYDYHVAMEEVGKAYSELTNGMVSKLNTEAKTVVSLADAYYDKFISGIVADSLRYMSVSEVAQWIEENLPEGS